MENKCLCCGVVLPKSTAICHGCETIGGYYCICGCGGYRCMEHITDADCGSL
jgi:hypothetical protein